MEAVIREAHAAAEQTNVANVELTVGDEYSLDYETGTRWHTHTRCSNT